MCRSVDSIIIIRHILWVLYDSGVVYACVSMYPNVISIMLVAIGCSDDPHKDAPGATRRKI